MYIFAQLGDYFDNFSEIMKDLKLNPGVKVEYNILYSCFSSSNLEPMKQKTESIWLYLFQYIELQELSLHFHNNSRYIMKYT